MLGKKNRSSWLTRVVNISVALLLVGGLMPLASTPSVYAEESIDASQFSGSESEATEPETGEAAEAAEGTAVESFYLAQPVSKEELEEQLARGTEAGVLRWEYPLDEEWIPEGYKQQYLTDAKTGKPYYTLTDEAPDLEVAPRMLGGALETQATMEVVDSVAELTALVQNATEDTTITLSQDFLNDFQSSSATIALQNSSGRSIILDGDRKILHRTSTNRFFSLNITNNSSFTFANMTLERTGAGVAVTSNSGRVMFDKVNISGSALATAVTLEAADTLISGCAFTGNTKAIGMSGITNNKVVQIELSRFADNTADYGAAITLANNTTLNITDTSFMRNTGTAGGYSGGAITANQTTNVNINIANSYFEENLSPYAAPFGGQGGAIALYLGTNVNLTVEQSCFKENSARLSTGGSTCDGGAISAYMQGEDYSGTVRISDSTFEGNYAGDDGGALHLEGQATNPLRGNTLTAEVTRCTFSGNTADQTGGGLAGGAVQVFGKAGVTFTACTFYGNTAVGAGAGIGLGGGVYWGISISPAVTLMSNLFVGNSAGTSQSAYRNVSGVSSAVFISSSGITDGGGNIGLDAGKTFSADLTVSSVFETDTPLLQENHCGVSAGDPAVEGEHTIIKTLYIAPRLDTTPGIYADGSGSEILGVDERQIARNDALPDSGAVDISWVKLDPNNGTWNTLSIGYYPDTHMLLDKNQVYAAGDNEETLALPDQLIFSAAAPETEILLGWGLRPNTEPGDDDFFAIGNTVNRDEKTTYYALWGAATKVTLTYDGNGNTDGEAPREYGPFDPETHVVIADQGTLVKEGCKFTRWDSKPDGSGESYLPGAAFVLTQNMTLYAQWTAQLSIQYDGNGNTGGTVPVDQSGPHDPGTLVLVADRGDLVREGYDFIGWNTMPDGSGTSYQPGDSLLLAEDVILYAQWSEQPPQPAPVQPAAKNVPGGKTPVTYDSKILIGGAALLLIIASLLIGLGVRRRNSSGSTENRR